MNLKQQARKFKEDISVIFLAVKDKRTPVIVKVMGGITVAYALSPIDLIPDFIPVLGYLDDIILLPIFVAITIKLIPKEVVEACRIKAQGMWKDGKPKRWYFAVPIIIFWLLVLGLVAKIILLR